MVVAAPPPRSLVVPVAILEEYLVSRPEKPILAVGSSGSGRGHWIDVVAARNGYRTVWTSDLDEAIPSSDLEGNALLPVYDVDYNPERPPTPPDVGPAVFFHPTGTPDPEAFRGYPTAYFPLPAPWEVETFLQERGYPISLAQGNPDYGSARCAMLAYDIARVHTSSDPIRPRTWEEFRRGGEAPADGLSFAFYASLAFPPEEWWWNLALGMQRPGRVSSRIADLFLEEVRLRWPQRDPPFPPLLKLRAKTRREHDRAERRLQRDSLPDSPTGPTAAEPNPAYEVDW